MSPRSPRIRPEHAITSARRFDIASAGFTIYQVAAFIGVDVETVRQYHQDGLADEPDPGSAGIRRYRPAQTLQLVRIRGLAGAGVPRNEIRALLNYLDHVEQILFGVAGDRLR
ncbi:MerR HTH family regulatory protein [Nocardia amikacinitolerans]|uniref:MerR HTH family regulatory protein n=1 Tax=Nocardia amikacinitolerans TaxID=756689 RepID=A0A285KPS6_9NOCA|nr:MerR family transcriptional regulator [Nocardia amikacinitolerans]SNY74213.1 MerR HTH family regulatory protein [Nocardia amikacinitolerans]